jgi:hypothetical protein
LALPRGLGTERKRAERDIERAQQPRSQSAQVDWAAIDAHIAAALAEQRRELIAKISDVASAAEELSKAVDAKLVQLERTLNKQPDVAKDIAALRAQCAALQTGAQAERERSRDLKTLVDKLFDRIENVDKSWRSWKFNHYDQAEQS